MESNTEHFLVNQRSWDEITPVHLRGSRYWYPIDEFKCGRCSLRPLELHEVGEVAGKSLLHLQCHFGMDTPLVGPPRRQGHGRGLLGGGDQGRAVALSRNRCASRLRLLQPL